MSESAPTDRSHSAQSESVQADALFVASAQPKPSLTTILLFVLVALLVFGGFYLMGAAFSVAEGLGFWFFAGGLALDVIGFWLAFGIIPNRR